MTASTIFEFYYILSKWNECIEQPSLSEWSEIVITWCGYLLLAKNYQFIIQRNHKVRSISDLEIKECAGNTIIARSDYYVGFGTESALRENSCILLIVSMLLKNVSVQDTKYVVESRDNLNIVIWVLTEFDIDQKLHIISWFLCSHGPISWISPDVEIMKNNDRDYSGNHCHQLYHTPTRAYFTHNLVM